MSTKSEPPLWIEVQQSHYLLIFIYSIHSLAILSNLLLGVSFALKLLILILVCYSLYEHLLRYKQGFYKCVIKYTSEFSWELFSNNQLRSIHILNTSVLSSFVIVLHVESHNKRHNILVCRDAVPTEAYRQLLVALKITATGPQNSINQ